MREHIYCTVWLHEKKSPRISWYWIMLFKSAPHESEKNKKKKVAQSCLTLWLHGLHNPWNSPGQNTGVGSLFLFQGLFSTQGLNPRLLHCRQILYQLSHQGSPRILEWVGIPFSSGSCQPRNRIRVSHIAGRFFTNWAIREAQCSPY